MKYKLMDRMITSKTGCDGNRKSLNFQETDLCF